MLKRFYSYPLSVQWAIALLLFVGGVGALAPLFLKPYGLLVLPLIAPLLNLVTVPFFRLIGYYKYLNPYVISTEQTDKTYDLHNVFTFDYLVNFTWADRGKPVQMTLLLHYFKALETIIQRIEKEELNSNVLIVGHSYFFNDRTAEKLGFKVKKAGAFWIFNSCLQFIELSYLYSFSQGRWAFPAFWKVKRAEIHGHDLVKKKLYIQNLITKLERHTSS